MPTLTEQAAEFLLAAHAFAPGAPGLTGAALDLPSTGAPDGQHPLRHGFLRVRDSRATLSGPPSPGIEACLTRLTEDLAQLPEHPASAAAATTGPLEAGAADRDEAEPDAHGGIRIGLEAGADEVSLAQRWVLAHSLAPVLAAAFANTPLRHGRASGWRSLRQARHRDRPALPPGPDPRAAWAREALDSPGPDGRTFRDRARSAGRPSLADLARHVDTLRPPVAARGHLEFDVADRQSGDGWRVAVAVTAALMDDPRAAAAAHEATAPLTGQPCLWRRAARDALTDPALAAAARDCFVAAYGALGRQGVARDLRDAVAAYTERYVLRGRTPADDQLDASLPAA